MTSSRVFLGVNGTSRTVWYDLPTGRTRRAGWMTADARVNGVVDRVGLRKIALHVPARSTGLVLQSGTTQLIDRCGLDVDLQESHRGTRLVVTGGGERISAFERDQRLSRDEQSWGFLAFIAHALTDDAERRRLIDLWSVE